MFRQFRENISAGQDTYNAAREGFRSVREAYRKAEPLKKIVWLAVPAIVITEAVGRYFSLAWYIRFLLALVLIAVAARNTHTPSRTSDVERP